MFSYRLATSDDEVQWDAFVATNEPLCGGLLQSWGWGIFQRSCGNKIFRFISEDKDDWLMVIFIVELTLPFHKRILYIPRGPIFQKKVSFQLQIQLLGTFISMFQEKYAIPEHIFFRLDSYWEEKEDIRNILKQSGWHEAFRSIQPRETLLVQLEKKEEVLWKELKQKTRYNIQIARRYGVCVRSVLADDVSSFQKFYQLLCETAKRDHFFLHPENYYKNMLWTKGKKEPLFQLFVAETENTLHAGAIVGFFGGIATYLHGASHYESRAFMSPYMLHWEIMQEAQRRHCRAYDLNGVRDKKSPSSWEGITRFKRGFAPLEEILSNIGTWEFPLRTIWYAWYHMRDWWHHSPIL